MKTKKNSKTMLIALLVAGTIIGIGYGMSQAAKAGEVKTAAASTVSTGAPTPSNNFFMHCEEKESARSNHELWWASETPRNPSTRESLLSGLQK